MKKQRNSATEKLIEKFDTQLRDILSAEIKSVRYARTKTIHWELSQPLAS